jgi:hypothetical protein
LTIRLKKFVAVVMLMVLMFSLVPLTVIADMLEEYTLCASEGGTCSFTGTRTVAFGANGVFNYKEITASTACTNSVFGDPIGGVVKACYYSNVDVNADTIAPTTSDNAPTNWVNQEITVDLTATDNQDGSGVAHTYYTIDGGEQQTGTSVVLTAGGAYTIEYWSEDNAGNVEDKHSKTVTVKLLPSNSNGQFDISDVVSIINQDTLEQKEMNGDGIFDYKDIIIMLRGITPMFTSIPMPTY